MVPPRQTHIIQTKVEGIPIEKKKIAVMKNPQVKIKKRKIKIKKKETKKEKIKREALYIKLHWILQSEVFNEKGMAALNSGRIESFFNPNIVERFRKPPAHTRYVMVSIANKCKDYVEKTVEELHAYYK